MNPVDWDNPRIKKIGKRFKLEAFDLADNLHSYGADASTYLLPLEERAKRWAAVDNVCIPAAFADALMALLLALPRPERGPGRRRLWSVSEAQQLRADGKSIRAIARIFSRRTGQPFESIRRRLQELFGGN